MGACDCHGDTALRDRGGFLSGSRFCKHLALLEKRFAGSAATICDSFHAFGLQADGTHSVGMAATVSRTLEGHGHRRVRLLRGQHHFLRIRC